MKIHTILTLAASAAITFAAASCNAGKGKAETKAEAGNGTAAAAAPTFNEDSAYSYVKAQVDFGPRIPNSQAHKACGDYLASKLESFGATVANQYADLTMFDGTLLKARNIIGSYRPESKKRVALFAHWDTRPWADKDPDESKHSNPVTGANDGASGVGVLLEVARLIQANAPFIGVDIIFFDAEDCGAPDTYRGRHEEEHWCLGSQYWSRFPHAQGYNARYGILLDMVGGRNATFYQEAYSMQYAGSIVEKVWTQAAASGYGSYFIPERGGAVTDDHLFVNRIARIPTIDIIPMDETYGFGEFWHTTGDTMDVIDKNTLKAVGQTIINVIYDEK